MKTQKYTTIQQFIEQFDWNRLETNTLVISDIDGVYFKGVFDPHEVLGFMAKRNRTSLQQILKKVEGFWILSNRWAMFRHFPYIRQIANMIKEVTTTTPNLYSNCSMFLQDSLQNYSIILNAQKPLPDSQKVIKRGLDNFNSVIYIGGDDLIFTFSDERLAQEVEEKYKPENFTFISISPKNNVK